MLTISDENRNKFVVSFGSGMPELTLDWCYGYFGTLCFGVDAAAAEIFSEIFYDLHFLLTMEMIQSFAKSR
ncbi:hypothetical protein L6452_06707 [Arctium lappa]|uniref:Uncharacterized protein n=1 Tax=Arctium lappa TaxID=4217 RepID=A0ACB9EKZ1_ARCLA|nr:hypothetical protein L6452_06707 [Arctium lappa]